MRMQDALGRYLADHGLIDDPGSPEAWYSGGWFTARVFGVRIPIVPRAGFRAGLPAHDAHHMLLGYATTWAGECETAAWELASGGCGRHGLYWIDRLFFLLLAPMIAPLRTWHAFRAGLGRRNLYGLDAERLLAMDAEQVARRLDRA